MNPANDGHEQRLRDLVVRRPDDAPREDGAGRERDDEDREDAARAPADAAPDEVDRDGDERPEHGRVEQQRHRHLVVGRVPEADDQRRERGYLVEQRAELPDGRPLREARPWVERHRPREVVDGPLGLPEVVPRVVPAEQDLAVVRDEPFPRPHAVPQHEHEEGRDHGDVVQVSYPLESDVGIEVDTVLSLGRLTHYLSRTVKPA